MESPVSWVTRPRGCAGSVMGTSGATRVGLSEAGAAGAARVVAAVGGGALPADRVGEPPRLVGPEALVEGDDLARRLGNPGERAAQLADGAARRDQRAAHLFAALARLGDLREAELARGRAGEPAAGEIQAGLRVVVGTRLAVDAVLDLVVN